MKKYRQQKETNRNAYNGAAASPAGISRNTTKEEEAGVRRELGADRPCGSSSSPTPTSIIPPTLAAVPAAVTGPPDEEASEPEERNSMDGETAVQMIQPAAVANVNDEEQEIYVPPTSAAATAEIVMTTTSEDNTDDFWDDEEHGEDDGFWDKTPRRTLAAPTAAGRTATATTSTTTNPSKEARDREPPVQSTPPFSENVDHQNEDQEIYVPPAEAAAEIVMTTSNDTDDFWDNEEHGDDDDFWDNTPRIRTLAAARPAAATTPNNTDPQELVQTTQPALANVDHRHNEDQEIVSVPPAAAADEPVMMTTSDDTDDFWDDEEQGIYIPPAVAAAEAVMSTTTKTTDDDEEGDDDYNYDDDDNNNNYDDDFWENSARRRRRGITPTREKTRTTTRTSAPLPNNDDILQKQQPGAYAITPEPKPGAYAMTPEQGSTTLRAVAVAAAATATARSAKIKIRANSPNRGERRNRMNPALANDIRRGGRTNRGLRAKSHSPSSSNRMNPALANDIRRGGRTNRGLRGKSHSPSSNRMNPALANDIRRGGRTNRGLREKSHSPSSNRMNPALSNDIRRRGRTNRGLRGKSHSPSSYRMNPALANDIRRGGRTNRGLRGKSHSPSSNRMNLALANGIRRGTKRGLCGRSPSPSARGGTLGPINNNIRGRSKSPATNRGLQGKSPVRRLKSGPSTVGRTCPINDSKSPVRRLKSGPSTVGRSSPFTNDIMSDRSNSPTTTNRGLRGRSPPRGVRRSPSPVPAVVHQHGRGLGKNQPPNPTRLQEATIIQQQQEDVVSSEPSNSSQSEQRPLHTMGDVAEDDNTQDDSGEEGDIENAINHLPDLDGDINHDGLVEAVPIVSSYRSSRRVMAQLVSQGNLNQQEVREAKHTKCKIIAWSIVVMACLALALSLSIGFRREKKGSNTVAADTKVTAAPTTDTIKTLAPTPLPLPPMENLEILYQELPIKSKESLYNRDSPQYQAWEWLLNHPNITGLEEWRKKQIFAMATLFYSFEGPNWPESFPRHDKWMDVTTPECTWVLSETGSNYYYQSSIQIIGENAYGPEDYQSCSEDGQLKVLALNQLYLPSNLNPSIPPEVGLLTSIKILGMAFSAINAKISDLLVPEIINHPSLESINFHDNGMSGQLGLMTELGLMTSLRHLFIGANKLTGAIPLEISNMKKLEVLSVSQMEGLTGMLPSELGLITSLTGLLTYGTPHIPSELGLLSNIAKLELWNSALTGPIPSELGLMTNAIDFRIGNDLTQKGSYNSFSGSVPKELWELSHMEKLFLPNLPHLHGRVPTEIAMPNLTMFDLRGNPYFSGTIPDQVCKFVDELYFDCSDLLCGCDCHCAGSAN